MRYDHLSMLPINAFKPLLGKITFEGGGGKGGDMPDAPDYAALAQLEAKNQQALLEKQTQANRVNQYGPLGSVTYTRGGSGYNEDAFNRAMQQYNQQLSSYSNQPAVGNNALQSYGTAGGFQYQLPASSQSGSSYSNQNSPIAPKREDFGFNPDQWNQYTTLTPEMQAILDQNIDAKGQSYDQLQTALGNINNNNLPQASVNAGETAQDAIMRRVNPQLQQQEDALRTRLVNQGVRPGTQAWDREYNLFTQARNDAVSQAALQGINVGNDARARALAEQSIPINLINAYQSGGQAQMPQFQNFAQQGVAQSPDLLGAAQGQYGAQLNSYNAGQASNASTLGGLFSLGGSIIGGGGLGSIFGF